MKKVCRVNLQCSQAIDLCHEITERIRKWISNQDTVRTPSAVLFSGSPRTVQDAIDGVSKLVVDNNLTNKAAQQTYDLLNNLLPEDSNMPKRFERYGVDDIFTFHCCPCGFTVYVADNADRNTCANPHCQFKTRYTPGDKRNRTALMEVNYRSLLLVFCELLSTNMFVEALTCASADTSIPGLYTDVCDGGVSRTHVADMDIQYNSYLTKSWPQQAKNGAKLVKINLLLSLYYDGLQLFKRRSQNFWPLVFSILSLPPALRKHPGAGMITISLLSTPPGSNAEQFIFESLVKELNLLKHGVVVPVNGTMYFVQARLILQCYDRHT